MGLRLGHVLLSATLALLPVAATAQPWLTAEGTEFVLHLDAKHVLRSADLVGAKLVLRVDGKPVTLGIAGVTPDAEAVGGPVFLHRLQMVRDGARSDFCAPDAEGHSLGFPIPDGKGGFTLACTSGAEGKCVRLGYRPWDAQPGGPPLDALYRACIFMIRADYGGDGKATTHNGVRIDVCDRFGIEPCQDSPMPFEAAWSVTGAICVAHLRVAENVALSDLAARYPRFAGKLGPKNCTMAGALATPDALLFDRSAGS